MISGWWVLMLPFPGALIVAAVMCAAVPVGGFLERRRERRYDPGIPVVQARGRPGYRGWAWHVEDGQVRQGP